MEAPFVAVLTADQVAFGLYTLTTLEVYLAASAAASSAASR